MKPMALGIRESTIRLPFLRATSSAWLSVANASENRPLLPWIMPR